MLSHLEAAGVDRFTKLNADLQGQIQYVNEVISKERDFSLEALYKKKQGETDEELAERSKVVIKKKVRALFKPLTGKTID